MTALHRLLVSRITLGTMRLQKAGDAGEAALFLNEAREMGVRSFHCSHEYESFPLFAEAWNSAGLRSTGATVVAKIASPPFGGTVFSDREVRDTLEKYRRALKVDRIDIVQWLLRYDLSQDEVRLQILLDSADRIADVFATLKREGLIGSLVAFPYSRPIADELVRAEWIDGLTLYVNPLEREMEGVLDDCASAGKPVLAIRPFAAGRLFTETNQGVTDALEYAFGMAAVQTSVVSVSSREHLRALTPWLQS